MDWKDMLSHLRDELPQAEESAEETADEIRAEKQGLKKETIRIVVEKKGRKGKTATIAEGFTCIRTESGSDSVDCRISDCKSMFYNNMKNFAKKIVLCNFASGTNVPR